MNGHNFGGERAKRIKAVLEQAKRDPNYARKLFGLKPKEQRP